jgi:GNAT superfamily N-acetyltransferase
MFMRLQPYTSSDFARLNAFVNTIWPAGYEPLPIILSKAENGIVLLALDAKNTLIGYGVAYTWAGELPALSDTECHSTEEPYWHLHDVSVEPTLRRQGVGGKIMAALLKANPGHDKAKAVAVSNYIRDPLLKIGFIATDEIVPADYGLGQTYTLFLNKPKTETEIEE